MEVGSQEAMGQIGERSSEFICRGCCAYLRFPPAHVTMTFLRVCFSPGGGSPEAWAGVSQSSELQTKAKSLASMWVPIQQQTYQEWRKSGEESFTWQLQFRAWMWMWLLEIPWSPTWCIIWALQVKKKENTRLLTCRRSDNLRWTKELAMRIRGQEATLSVPSRR